MEMPNYEVAAAAALLLRTDSLARKLCAEAERLFLRGWAAGGWRGLSCFFFGSSYRKLVPGGMWCATRLLLHGSCIDRHRGGGMRGWSIGTRFVCLRKNKSPDEGGREGGREGKRERFWVFRFARYVLVVMK